MRCRGHSRLYALGPARNVPDGSIGQTSGQTTDASYFALTFATLDTILSHFASYKEGQCLLNS